MRTSSGKIKKGLIIVISAVFVVTAVLISMFFSSKSNKIYKTVTAEAGTKTLDISQFIKDKDTSGAFITDLSAINMNAPGVYEIKIQIGKKVYSSNLEVKDTVPPTAETVNQEIWAKEEKEPKEFVKNIVDATAVKVSFKEQPDFSKGGAQEVLVILEDASSNKSELKAALMVKEDKEPPVINGTRNQTIYIGDAVAYKKDVTVTDNRDESAQLTVDSSAVDLKKAGSYNVTYTATDSTGNTSTKTVVFKVTEKPKVAVNIDDLDALADKVLATIITNGMSKKEKAKAIYKWTKSHISYIDNSDKSDWVKAAIQGFNKAKGDCFNYFATAQALLNRAGIQNQGIVKSNGHHYWSLINIDNAWYHFDTTPRKGDNNFYSLFMLTDAQVEAYSKAHKNSHVWDKAKYPATP
jgi:transglutaminase/protease-like cytokinesis protein 3